MTGISHCFPMSFPIEKPASVGLLDGLEELQRLLRRLDPTSHLGWECNKQYNILIWTYLLFVLFIHIIWTIHIDIIDTNICSNNYVYIYIYEHIYCINNIYDYLCTCAFVFDIQLWTLELHASPKPACTSQQVTKGEIPEVPRGIKRGHASRNSG